MKKQLYCVIILFVTSFAFAGENVFVDNQYIQQYRGNLGLWVEADSSPKLKRIINTFGSSEDAVAGLNGSENRSGFVFVPFSEEYLSGLEKKGIKRNKEASGENEFIWPIEDFDHISSPFGYRYGQLHTGADMPAIKGTPIVASMDGKVVFCGYSEGHGNTVLLEHRNNFYTRYSHNSAIFVKKGECVVKGQVIGLVGSSGNSTGNHLHFEVRYDSIPLNPLDFLPPNKKIKQVHTIKLR